MWAIYMYIYIYLERMETAMVIYSFISYTSIHYIFYSDVSRILVGAMITAMWAMAVRSVPKMSCAGSTAASMTTRPECRCGPFQKAYPTQCCKINFGQGVHIFLHQDIQCNVWANDIDVSRNTKQLFYTKRFYNFISFKNYPEFQRYIYIYTYS